MSIGTGLFLVCGIAAAALGIVALVIGDER